MQNMLAASSFTGNVQKKAPTWSNIVDEKIPYDRFKPIKCAGKEWDDFSGILKILIASERSGMSEKVSVKGDNTRGDIINWGIIEGGSSSGVNIGEQEKEDGAFIKEDPEMSQAHVHMGAFLALPALAFRLSNINQIKQGEEMAEEVFSHFFPVNLADKLAKVHITKEELTVLQEFQLKDKVTSIKDMIELLPERESGIKHKLKTPPADARDFTNLNSIRDQTVTEASEDNNYKTVDDANIKQANTETDNFRTLDKDVIGTTLSNYDTYRAEAKGGTQFFGSGEELNEGTEEVSSAASFAWNELKEEMDGNHGHTRENTHGLDENQQKMQKDGFIEPNTSKVLDHGGSFSAEDEPSDSEFPGREIPGREFPDRELSGGQLSDGELPGKELPGRDLNKNPLSNEELSSEEQIITKQHSEVKTNIPLEAGIEDINYERGKGFHFSQGKTGNHDQNPSMELSPVSHGQEGSEENLDDFGLKDMSFYARVNQINYDREGNVNSQNNTMKTSLDMENISGQIIESVRFSKGRDTQQFDIQLIPEDLGRIRVRLIEESGKLGAYLTAESESVAEHIRSHLPGFRETLANEGIVIEDVLVDIDQGSEGSSGGYNQDFQREYAVADDRKPETTSSNNDIKDRAMHTDSIHNDLMLDYIG